MRKKTIVIILLVLLTMLLLYSLSMQRKQKSDNLVGTYCTSGNQPIEGDYYVLQLDGNYTKYRQFQILEQGTYIYEINGDARIITLSNGMSEKDILHVNSRLYEYTQDGIIAVYEKISEQSVYANVHDAP